MNESAKTCEFVPTEPEEQSPPTPAEDELFEFGSVKAETKGSVAGNQWDGGLGRWH